MRKRFYLQKKLKWTSMFLLIMLFQTGLNEASQRAAQRVPAKLGPKKKEVRKEGVLVYKPAKCFNGFTLFCTSYEDPSLTKDGRGEIYLINMEGKPVHIWHVKTALQSFCRLLPNGDLLYPTRDRSNIKRSGLRRLDPFSKVLWYYHCRIDHDYQVLENGNIMIHTITDYMWPELGNELKRNPYIIEITLDKELVWEWHGEKHLGELKTLLSQEQWRFIEARVKNKFAFDWAHNNTCQIIPPNATYEKEKAAGGPVRFKPGNIIFSYRSLDVIGAIDRQTAKIVWAWGPGVLDGQHKPHMLENGHILIFDNGTLRGYSRVIEMDPLTDQIVWQYTSKPKEKFLSRYISGAQRLPNGNTLICEGGKRHLFEVTPQGQIVWDFYNPYYEHGDLKSIYRCLRYSPEYVRPLLERNRRKIE